jgi:seryl-tRNA synthetase
MEDYQYSEYKESIIKEVNVDQKSVLKEEIYLLNEKDDRVSSGIFNISNQICNIAFPKVPVIQGGNNILEQNIHEFEKVELFSIVHPEQSYN